MIEDKGQLSPNLSRAPQLRLTLLGRGGSADLIDNFLSISPLVGGAAGAAPGDKGPAVPAMVEFVDHKKKGE
jgi:hypothetical protein